MWAAGLPSHALGSPPLSSPLLPVCPRPGSAHLHHPLPLSRATLSGRGQQTGFQRAEQGCGLRAFLRPWMRRPPRRAGWLHTPASLAVGGAEALPWQELSCLWLWSMEGGGRNGGKEGPSLESLGHWVTHCPSRGKGWSGTQEQGTQAPALASTGSAPPPHPHTPVPGVAPGAREAETTPHWAKWLRAAGRAARFETTARAGGLDRGTVMGGLSDAVGWLEIWSLPYWPPHPPTR